MKIKNISIKQISFIAFASILLIFGIQSYFVYDYFLTTYTAIERESDDILLNSFRRDLGIRNGMFKKIINADNIVIPPPPTDENTVFVDMSNVKQKSKNVVDMIDLAINHAISEKVPLDIDRIDSITGVILMERNIDTKYFLKTINPSANNAVLNQSRELSGLFQFLVYSNNLNIDIANKQALQLVLINPFSLILQRMALMLITSLVFSVICVLAFVYLQRILARQKQLVAFKNEFLGTIAHELKRPVASLVFNLDCLSQSAQVAAGGQNAMLLQNSLRATEEMNDSINMIVNLTKLEEGMLELRHEQIGLMQMFEELKDRFTSISSKKPDISISCEPQLKTLWGDRQLLMQCFANLIDNAIKYSGDVVRIQISVRSEDNRVLVSVRDNGFGIPADKLVFLFDKYSRLHTDATKINGFGIGLNYVKNIVEKHRGEVRVASEPGQGSEFCVLLPVA
jgi:two-component system phosphate regulon sensor histidine kinase PhoR